ncbi:MAG: NAD(P)/FAD-dependent oxidoreductase [Clostridiales bacterium]|nr:NAD(P)/FAD-dependent oxidoreductase [Clostridiales bacterium]
MQDVIIIGAGVVGCAVAQRLGNYAGKVMVLEAANDVSCGASKANSGIVHAGYDAQPGTDKARLNIKGARMMQELCSALGVPYGKPGALVLAFDQGDKPALEALLAKAEENGVPGCRIIGRREILAMEPLVNPQVHYALHVPESGLVGPYELTCALADAAAENGVRFQMNTRVKALRHEGKAWVVETDQGDYACRAVVNCAGVGAGELHNQISSRQVEIIPRRGQYYLLDHTQPLAFQMTLFQLPTVMGKGVLISPTTHGNLLFGPTAEDIPDGQDTATTHKGLQEVLSKVRLSYPEASTRTVITTFSGIRAHEKGGDFIIGAVEGAPEGAFEAIGIESPGLTAAPAIGEEMGDWVAYYLKLKTNPRYIPPTPLPKAFSTMSEQERRIACQTDPDYGKVICRCETVTEAEVRRAIRRPVGARDIDGIKRRVRAGMGRCQGGFCMTRVMEIISEETGIPFEEVSKKGPGSAVLTGPIGEAEDE